MCVRVSVCARVCTRVLVRVRALYVFVCAHAWRQMLCRSNIVFQARVRVFLEGDKALSVVRLARLCWADGLAPCGTPGTGWRLVDISKCWLCRGTAAIAILTVIVGREAEAQPEALSEVACLHG